MIFSSENISRQIKALQRAGKLPRTLSRDQVVKLTRALTKYSQDVPQRILTGWLDDFAAKTRSALAVQSPETIRGLLADLGNFAAPEIADRIKFAFDVSQQVVSGAGQYLNQNLSPKVLDEFPALELKRLFDRSVPRGFKRGPRGVLMAVPEDNWPNRWDAAGAAAGDESWLPWQGDDQTGRGVALKSSGIWQALGDGAGGYDDTLGNPFPPFAFNSGFMTFDVSRKEAVALGLIGADEEAKPAAINFDKFFNLEEAA